MATAEDYDALAEGAFGDVDAYTLLTEEEAADIAETYDAPETGITDPTLGIAGGLVYPGTGDFDTLESAQEETVRVTEATSAGAIADPAVGAETTTDTDPHGWAPSAVDWWEDNAPELEPDLAWLDWFKWVALAAVLLYLAKPGLEIGANLTE